MLTLTAPPVPVWERFHEHRFSDAEISADPLLSRWDRSARRGVRGDADGVPIAGSTEACAQLDRVLGPGSPYAAFGAAMAAAGLSALVCDAAGVVLRRHADLSLQSTLLATRLVEGATWSEDARGTNAIGTAIVERVPVTVLGAAHYERTNHALCCYAAPLHDPSGMLVGVLDASGPVAMAHPSLQAAVLGTSAAIEAMLASERYDAAVPGGLAALRRRLARCEGAVFVLEVTGRVRLANEAARRMLGAREHLQRALVRRFGLPTIEAGTRLAKGMRIEVEPIGPSAAPWAAIVHVSPQRTTARKPAPSTDGGAFAPIVGSDPAIVHARARSQQFARSQLPVLLLAETGTGKEMFARAIHRASPRADRPFVAVNCGALTGSLLESELFGYAAGAFTGARASGHDGKIAAADGGTLFLDEVAEMSPAAQALVLRFLEDGTYYPVGDTREHRADVRIVAATCRDLSALVLSGGFRSDLFYRIRGVAIRLAPLRERRDIDELSEALLLKIAARYGDDTPPTLGTAARRRLAEHPWPGNVRELRTALEHAYVLAGSGGVIEPEHLPCDEPVGEATSSRAAAEREATVRALEATGGNLSATARRLGVSRSTLYRLLERHGLRAP
jgi:transcriptional regulator of acetoin/glycerol metabolism